MTISNTASYCTFVFNGAQTVFNLQNGAQGIYYADAAELSVSVRNGDTLTPLTLATHYTLTGAGTDTGTITFLTVYANGLEGRVERNTAMTQALSLTAGGAFNPTTVGSALDKLTREAQDIDRSADRAVKIALSDLVAGVSPILPRAVASKYLGFNATATALELLNAADFEMTVGTVTTGAAGSSAIVTITGTPTDALLNLTIPRGDQGASGAGSGDLVAAQNLSDLASRKTGFDNISIKAANVAVQASIDLDAATGNLVHITGTNGNDSFTKILLKMDGTDASTTFTDSNAGGSAHTWTAAGNAQIDTAASKFGGAAGLFDGTGDRVTTPDHADYTLGSGDWTVDCWFNCTAASGTYEVLFGQADATPAITSKSVYGWRRDTNVIVGVAVVGTTEYSVTGTTQFTNAVNTGWHHCAVVRTGNTLKLFIDGVQEGGNVAISGSVNDSANAWGVGSLGEYVADPWTGWLDEFRLSVGIARWTAGFTPPTVSHGDTTQLVVATLASGRERTLIFDGAPILVNSASLVLPSAANIQVAAGDSAIVRGDGSSVSKVVSFERATGAPLALADNATTNAKLADVPTATFKGRTTAATGDPEDLTVAQAVALLGCSTLLASGTVTAAATLDIVLTSYTAYRGIVVELINVYPSNDDAELWMRFSTNGGSTYDAGASDYNYMTHGARNGSASMYFYTSTGDTEMVVAGTAAATESVSNVAAEGGASVTVKIMNQTATGHWTAACWSGSYWAALSDRFTLDGAGTRTVAQDTDAVRFLFESGTMTGKYAVYGLS